MEDFKHGLWVNWGLELHFAIDGSDFVVGGEPPSDSLMRGYVASHIVMCGYSLTLCYTRQQPRISFCEAVSLVFYFILCDSPTFFYLEKSFGIFDDFLTPSVLLWQ